MLTLILTLLNVFINNLHDRMGCTFSKFLDDIKLGAEAGTLEGRIALQRHFVRQEKWVDRNFMNLKENKIKVLTHGEEAPQQHPADMRNLHPAIQPHHLLIWSQMYCPDIETSTSPGQIHPVPMASPHTASVRRSHGTNSRPFWWPSAGLVPAYQCPYTGCPSTVSIIPSLEHK